MALDPVMEGVLRRLGQVDKAVERLKYNEVSPASNDKALALAAMMGLPMAMSQAWIMPIARSGATIGSLPLAQMGTIAGTFGIGQVDGLVYGLELVANRGFETAGGGGADVFADWDEKTSGYGAVVDETSDVYAGSHACRLDSGNDYARVYGSIAVTAGETYILSFQNHGDGVDSLEYRVYDVSNGADIIAQQHTGVEGTAYTETIVRFDAPAGCAGVYLYFLNHGGDWSSVYVDAVSIRLIQETVSNTATYWAFDGATYIYFADGTWTDPRYALSCLAWVYFDNAIGTTERIFGKQSGGNNLTYIFNRQNTGTLSLCTSVNGTAHRWVNSTWTLEPTTWYCVAFAYDYVNGAAIFLGKTDGDYEYILDSGDVGVLYNNGVNFTIAAAHGGVVYMTGRIAVPPALFSAALTENWLVQYLDTTRILFL